MDQDGLSKKNKKNKIIRDDNDNELIKEPKPTSIDECLSDITKDILTLNQDFKKIKSKILKLSVLYKKESRKKNKCISKNDSRSSGFNKEEFIPKGISKLLKLQPNTKMTRPQITKKIYEYIKHKKLYYKKNKQVLRADKKLMSLFSLPSSVNKATDPSDEKAFTFFTIQTHIKKCFEKEKGNIIEENTDDESDDISSDSEGEGEVKGDNNVIK
jgi:chromatin remodeling complex protein RSC6